MEITALNLETDQDSAIRYVYEHAIPSKISYETFKMTILKDLSEPYNYYILKNEGNYIGYLLLFADSLNKVPKPYSALAYHNGDELSYEQHCELLKFAINKAEEKGYNKLEYLMKDELFILNKT